MCLCIYSEVALNRGEKRAWNASNRSKGRIYNILGFGFVGFFLTKKGNIWVSAFLLVFPQKRQEGLVSLLWTQQFPYGAVWDVSFSAQTWAKAACAIPASLRKQKLRANLGARGCEVREILLAKK